MIIARLRKKTNTFRSSVKTFRRIINYIVLVIKTNFIMISLAIDLLMLMFFGWWGLLISIVATAASSIYINKDLFITGLQQIEILIWGKPAEALKKGEKRPKVVLVWKKKK